ncbi:MAG: acylphosphatase [Elusimicrobia bacterium]|nr:acylphosphatase [Elusimicrobiota bacterium]
MKEVKAILKGRVQMVGFRFFTVRTARRLELKGYVKNLSAGEVETIAQGSRENLEKFIKNIKMGPASAEVKNADVSYREPQKEYTGFNVKY